MKRLSARPSGKDTPTSPEWEAPMDSVDDIVSRYHRLEVNSKKLHKSAKKYEDMMLGQYHYCRCYHGKSQLSFSNSIAKHVILTFR